MCLELRRACKSTMSRSRNANTSGTSECKLENPTCKLEAGPGSCNLPDFGSVHAHVSSLGKSAEAFFGGLRKCSSIIRSGIEIYDSG